LRASGNPLKTGVRSDQDGDWPAAAGAVRRRLNFRERVQEALAMSTPAEKRPGKRILYIDDDENFAFLVKTICERRGHQVTTFLDSAAALKAVEATPAAWDLVITDQRMPGPDGLEVARTLRDRVPDLACVMVSSVITEELTRAAQAAGVRRLLHKPYRPEHLIVLIEVATK
jgi:CheY-like chemotaxis protein